MNGQIDMCDQDKGQENGEAGIVDGIIGVGIVLELSVKRPYQYGNARGKKYIKNDVDFRSMCFGTGGGQYADEDGGRNGQCENAVNGWFFAAGVKSHV